MTPQRAQGWPLHLHLNSENSAPLGPLPFTILKHVHTFGGYSRTNGFCVFWCRWCLPETLPYAWLHCKLSNFEHTSFRSCVTQSTAKAARNVYLQLQQATWNRVPRAFVSLGFLNRALWYARTWVCSKNQKNAHFFHERFNLIILSSTCFEQPSVHPQEDVCMQFYGIFFMHPYKQSGQCQDVFLSNTSWHPDISFMHLYKQSGRCQDVFVSNTSWHRPDCLYRCMKEIPYIKLHVQVFLGINTCMFETCRRQYEV